MAESVLISSQFLDMFIALGNAIIYNTSIVSKSIYSFFKTSGKENG